MRIKDLGWWLAGMGAVLLAGCGGGEDSLPATPHAVMQHHAYDPQVAFDTAGNAIAVWSQFDGLRKNIWASRYVASSTVWSAPELIETNNGGDADFPHLALDAAGNALVVWEQSDSTRRNIWANRYTAANQRWGTAELLETDNTSFADAPQVALATNGNGMVVWEQSDGIRKSIWARRYNAGSAQWDVAGVIETSTQDANTPQIAVDANGVFIAVWRGYDGVTHQRYNLWANRYAAGVWGSAVLISDNAADPAALSDPRVSRDVDTPHIAMDAAGNALAVWAQANSIYANRYSVGTGWSAAQLIENDGNWAAAAPRIAMAANGQAYAVWEQYADSIPGDTIPLFKNIMANRYVPGAGGWQGAGLVETDNTGHAQAPQVAVDGAGTATVVWRQWDVTHYSVWSNRYVTASALWGTATLIETDNSGDVFTPQVAVDALGNALAVWGQSNGTRASIRANRYTAGGIWGAASILENN